MPYFRPIASLVREENEVTDARVKSRPIPIKNFKLPPSLCLPRFGGDNNNHPMLVL